MTPPQSALPVCGEFLPDKPFLGAKVGGNAWERARAVLLGLPMDYTVSFRPGSRFGPGRIRAVSEVLETYSPTWGRDLEEIPFCDLGDLALPCGNVPRTLAAIEQTAADVTAAGKFLLALGGEHLVTLPLVRALAQALPELVVVQLDAHADLREEYEGEALSHATVMRRLAEELGPARLYQLGIRSGTQAEFAWAREKTHFWPGERALAVREEILAALAGKPIYLTIDIDVLDPAFAPGTGTPEPGGWTTREFFSLLEDLLRLEVRGCDLVEVAPPCDDADRTSILAAKVVREILLSL